MMKYVFGFWKRYSHVDLGYKPLLVKTFEGPAEYCYDAAEDECDKIGPEACYDLIKTIED